MTGYTNIMQHEDGHWGPGVPEYKMPFEVKVEMLIRNFIWVLRGCPRMKRP